MCGIIAVLRRPSRRPPPSGEEVLGRLDRAGEALGNKEFTQAAEALEAVDGTLRGAPGVRAFLAEANLLKEVAARLDELEGEVAELDAWLDAGPSELSAADVEAVSAGLVRLRDGLWAIRRDRVRTAEAVADLLGDGEPDGSKDGAAVDAYTSIQVALSAIDRLEVRGRDSAGLHVLVEGHGLDLDGAEVRELLEERVTDRLFTSMAVRTSGEHLAFVYKAAAEIGELGDNTRRLRQAVRSDRLLRLALAAPDARAAVLGHTRWASVGIISEANAHPLNQEEEGKDPGCYVVGALNGDVDNYPTLKAREQVAVPVEVTTDAKVIPVLVSRRLTEGTELEEAFLSTARELDGSVAVAAACGDNPRKLLLALRGSGQALYVGLAEDEFVVASEPYGLVEETSRYLRMDGESGSVPGQVVVLDADRAGEVEGITRLAYDGSQLPVGEDELRTAEITTRDVDRGGFSHYLLKEISQAPVSVQKTLRGRLVANEGGHDGRTGANGGRPAANGGRPAANGGGYRVALGDETLPPALRQRLKDGAVRRVVAIGQGTAAVAAQSVAETMSLLLDRSGLGVSVVARPATELSGFGLADDMSDTLVVAVSQSGTTTDTNRTVDLVRARGAAVIGIVNRRNSDLVEKVDGVLYTSDGRDVEMAVPSTKAFYSQVAAGVLVAVGLAEAMAGEARPAWPERRDRPAWPERRGGPAASLLAGLAALPGAMADVLERRSAIAAIAQRHAPPRRYWAVVGNGANRIAAQEVRIKLSELCYKSIAFDLTEDKKHVDLSAEPLILVCAAGLSGTNAADVAKEVAIYRAHKACPIVIATEGDGEARFEAAVEVITVPQVDPAVAFVLSAMAGHLFGYEAALAVDAQARPLREIRAAVENVLRGDDGIDALDRLGALAEQPAALFLRDLRAGNYNGHLEASTALRIATALRHATSPYGLEDYEAETGRVATPTAFLADLTDALTLAIGELTRPVDAIKHQAKTVTVGISRSEEALYASSLVQAVLAAGAPRDRLGYRTLRSLAGLEPAVAEITGHTRYMVEGRVDEEATLRVVDRGGVARDIPTRTDRDPRLRGSKHRAATLRGVIVAKGGADQRTVVIVPEVKGDVTGITLLHARFHDRLPADDAQAVLAGYLDRYDALVDAVTEREPTFDEAVLAEIPIVDLLTEPVRVLAERWRHRD